MVIFHTYVSLPEGIRQNLDPHGGFPKYGYPQIIHFNRIFHYKPSSYLGTPIPGNPHMFVGAKKTSLAKTSGSYHPIHGYFHRVAPPRYKLGAITLSICSDIPRKPKFLELLIFSNLILINQLYMADLTP